jgi:hypothetical protein
MVSKFGVSFFGGLLGVFGGVEGVEGVGVEGGRGMFVNWTQVGGEVGGVEIDDGMGGMSAFLLLTVMLILFFGLVAVL